MRERFTNDYIENEVKNIILTPALNSDMEHYYESINLINQAYILMLLKQGIISINTAKILGREILAMREMPANSFSFTADKEDLYFNIEDYLIAKVGIDIAGQLHVGRSRNDLYATAARMRVKEVYLTTCEMIVNLLIEMLSIARRENGTVFTGYTHMQPAEPVSFGHYLCGVIEAMERDYARLNDLYARLNLSPLGSGALAGTSFEIDREYLAEILGFDGLIENSIDGVASRDYVLEILSGLAIFMTDIGRISQDLYIWATDEFSNIKVDDTLAVCSSIMPQKKNPITIEHIKAKASHINGALMSALCVFKGTPFSHCRDVSSEVFRLFWTAISETQNSISLFRITISTMSINRDSMVIQASKNFSTVTELANSIVRRYKISFRQVHGIIGNIVMKLAVEDKDALDIDYDVLREALEKYSIDLTRHAFNSIIEDALDPMRNINVKNSIGGPAAHSVLRNIDEIEQRLLGHKATLEKRHIKTKYLKRKLSIRILEL